MTTKIRSFVPKMLTALALAGAVTLLSSNAFAQSLSSPVGTWRIDANGFYGDLVITNANPVQGTIYGQQITGLWEAVPQKLTFMRISSTPASSQVYTGYVFPAQRGATAAGFKMGGSFEAISSASSGKVLYGGRHVV